jgi:hypothetical protein
MESSYLYLSFRALVITGAIVPITTNIVSSNPVHDEVYSIQHYMILLNDYEFS